MTPDGAEQVSPARGDSASRWRKIPFRKWLRSLHRDAGYLAVGLTFVYALSGIAINHIDDWDPNFSPVEKLHDYPAALDRLPPLVPDEPKSAHAAARSILTAIGRDEAIEDAYSIDETHLDITLEHSTLYLDTKRRTLREEGQKPRLLLRAANWLHLNRGKKAWTYIADGYAVFLVFLATSGLFMIKGRQGFLGRGGLLALVGALVPILYVTLSGGP